MKLFKQFICFYVFRYFLCCLHETIRANYANFDIWILSLAAHIQTLPRQKRFHYPPFGFIKLFCHFWAERMLLLSGDKCKNKWLSLSLSIRTPGAEINTPEMVVGPQVYMTGHMPDRVIQTWMYDITRLIQTCNVWDIIMYQIIIMEGNNEGLGLTLVV